MDDTQLTLIAILLVLLNGFFVAAEFAIVKLRRTQAEELGRTGGFFGRILREVRSRLDAYLSACQLGITLASLGLGWIGEPAFARLLAGPLAAIGLTSPDVVEGVALVVAFTLISFLHIVLGELAPKSIAIRRPVPVSLWTATPLFAFYWLMYPFIWVLNSSALLLLRATGVDLASEGDDAHSAQEIRTMLAASHRHGELSRHEADLLSRASEFGELTVGDLVRPASRMIVLDAARPPEELRAVIARHRFSRYPVCEGDRDHLIGLLHVKDLLVAGPEVALRDLVRELPRAHRDTRALTMLRRFRRGHAHLAAVVDDAETLVGFLTLDDLLQALVGRIQDEFRRPRADWRRLEDGSFEGRGWYSLHSLERLLGRAIDAEESDSVGGLLMQALDRVPQAGDQVAFEGFRVEVLEMRAARVEKVRVVPSDAPGPEKANPA